MEYLPFIIGGLGIVLAVLFIMQRQRKKTDEVLPPPDFGQPIDYTNPDIKEPETLGTRIRNAPMAAKVLLGVALVLLIGTIIVLVNILQPTSQPPLTPTPEPASITEVSATLSNPTRILVQANTNMPGGTQVTAQLLEDGQPFAWFTPETATGTVAGGKIQINLSKNPSAPTPSKNKAYTIALSAAGADGAQVSADAATLTVPQIYSNDFYASATTPTPKPTAKPTATVKATAVVSATATTAPTPTATSTLTGTVRNGGNVRDQPNFNGKVLDQNNAFEVVTLIEKSKDGVWYKMTNPRGTTGWFSASLLTVAPEVAAKVPVEGSAPAPEPTMEPTPAPTASGNTPPPTPASTGSQLTGYVWNGGNLRTAPSTQSDVVDQNNAGETVVLVAKSADGAWYKVTNPRGKTGWFSASLVRVDAGVAEQVPVGQ
ncbi:SH3 domain-containing protein [Chloroflexia bacterium SDU3-3]|nr:SH3 domain-containing protein [Chloroflexia bacterium SDU3-3]